MRTDKEIKAEIKALEACKKYIPPRTAFGDNNIARVDLQIEYLRGEIDPTATDEWDALCDDDQSTVLEAQEWKDGITKNSPSSGWDSFKPKTRK